MFGKYPVADAALLLSDPARVAILTSLMGGEARPAGELARIAGLSPQAASAHLTKLVGGQMLSLRRIGRHHYYQMVKAEVGVAIEALAVLTPLPKRAAGKESPEHRALRFARTCYDHLAGALAIQIWQSLEGRSFIELERGVPRLTAPGERFMSEFEIDTAELLKNRRPLTRACLDWTERQHHMAGALGSALLNRFLSNGWLVRQQGSRAVRLTPVGDREMRGLLASTQHSIAPIEAVSNGLFR